VVYTTAYSIRSHSSVTVFSNRGQHPGSRPVIWIKAPYTNVNHTRINATQFNTETPNPQTNDPKLTQTTDPYPTSGFQILNRATYRRSVSPIPIFFPDVRFLRFDLRAHWRCPGLREHACGGFVGHRSPRDGRGGTPEAFLTFRSRTSTGRGAAAGSTTGRRGWTVRHEPAGLTRARADGTAQHWGPGTGCWLGRYVRRWGPLTGPRGGRPALPELRPVWGCPGAGISLPVRCGTLNLYSVVKRAEGL
jgi:hypothetical protein